MRTQLTLLFISLFTTLVFIACKKNEGEVISHLTYPDFIASEEVADTFSITDTALTLNDIRFSPKLKYDSVIWEIDNGAFVQKKEVLTLKFINEGSYTVTMTGYNSSSGKTIKDKITKPFHVVSREGGASYLGSFRGYIAGMENDTFTIKIFRIEQDLTSYAFNSHVLSNLPKGCVSELPPDGITPLTTLYFGYKMFVTNAPRCFPGTKCIGNFNSGKLIIDFAIIDSTQPFNPTTGSYPLIPKKFIGHRL